MSEDFNKYLAIANHDIQVANNMSELKSYVASILYDNDKKVELLQQKENIINELKERSLQYSEEIDRLLDIKEEVRKYIEKASYFQGNKVLNEKDILEILDKENK